MGKSKEIKVTSKVQPSHLRWRLNCRTEHKNAASNHKPWTPHPGVWPVELLPFSSVIFMGILEIAAALANFPDWKHQPS